MTKKCIALCLAVLLAGGFICACATADGTQGQTDDVTTAETTTAADTSIVPVAPGDLIVILHGGGGVDGRTQQNAQEMFDVYYSRGYRYFEYDLMLSSDGRLMGLHDGSVLSLEDPYALTYEAFKQLRLPGGYTPVNEEWLIETILTHPDVKIVVDAKMPTTEEDALVLARIEELETLYGCDISANIIPEIFSPEMWEIAQQTTTFDRYFFSHYKVYFGVDTMLEYFGDPAIYGVALPTHTDGWIRSNLYKLKAAGKNIFVFTATTPQEVADAIAMGADGVYVDDPAVVEQLCNGQTG